VTSAGSSQTSLLGDFIEYQPLNDKFQSNPQSDCLKMQMVAYYLTATTTTAMTTTTTTTTTTITTTKSQQQQQQ